MEIGWDAFGFCSEALGFPAVNFNSRLKYKKVYQSPADRKSKKGGVRGSI